MVRPRVRPLEGLLRYLDERCVVSSAEIFNEQKVGETLRK